MLRHTGPIDYTRGTSGLYLTVYTYLTLCIAVTTMCIKYYYCVTILTIYTRYIHDIYTLIFYILIKH